MSTRWMKTLLFSGLMTAGSAFTAEYECWTSQNDGKRIVAEGIQYPQSLGKLNHWTEVSDEIGVFLSFSGSSSTNNTLEARDDKHVLASATFDKGAKTMQLYGTYRKQDVRFGWKDLTNFYIECTLRR